MKTLIFIYFYSKFPYNPYKPYKTTDRPTDRPTDKWGPGRVGPPGAPSN